MGKFDHDNAAINCSYLFRELTPKITESEYVKGQTIPGFLLGYPSVKAIRSMNLHILESHKRAIASGEIDQYPHLEVFFAFHMYVDFINLFLRVLRVLLVLKNRN